MSPVCHSLTDDGLPLGRSPVADRLVLPDIACSERYAVEVNCANQSFLFTRRNLGDSKRFDTIVRTGPTPPSNGGVALNARLSYSKPHPALPQSMLMSHNADVMCERGRLVAYGGMAHPPKRLRHLPEAGEDWLGDDVGITRSVALPALPLVWSPPQLVVSGSKIGTGCVHVLNGPGDCEYDGKLSAVRFKGRVYLYTRSNTHPAGGGRHVQARQRCGMTALLCLSSHARGCPQVTSSRDGISGWSRFQQLVVAGVTAGAAANNIYYFAVRRVWRRGREALFATFPAVLEVGSVTGTGVFVTTSFDGAKWSRPVRVLASKAHYGGRTDAHPFMGSFGQLMPGGMPGGGDGGEVSFGLEFRVDLRESYPRGFDDNYHCSKLPFVCVYTLSMSRLFQGQELGERGAPRPLAAPATAGEESGADGMEVAVATTKRAGSAEVEMGPGVETTAEATRDYLLAVYPAAAASIRQMGGQVLAQHFRSLDYLYNGCSRAALAQIRPPGACPAKLRPQRPDPARLRPQRPDPTRSDPRLARACDERAASVRPVCRVLSSV